MNLETYKTLVRQELQELANVTGASGDMLNTWFNAVECLRVPDMNMKVSEAADHCCNLALIVPSTQGPDDQIQRILDERQAAYDKAVDALGRYKFEMFGYWASAWVKYNQLLDPKYQADSPFADLVQLARTKQTGLSPRVTLWEMSVSDETGGYMIVTRTKKELNARLREEKRNDVTGSSIFMTPYKKEYDLDVDGLIKAIERAADIVPK